MAFLDLDKLKSAVKVPFVDDLLSVARVPNSDRLWIGSSDHKVYYLDLAAAKPQAEPYAGHTSYVSGVVLVDGALITAGWDRKLIWWDTAQRKPIRTVDAHQRWIRRLTLSADLRLVASISDDMTCKVWDSTSGKLLRELQGHDARLARYHYPNKLYACAFSPDGKFVAAADEACSVVVWETATGKEATKFQAPAFFMADWDRNNHPYGGLRCLAFSPDGAALALGGIQNTDVAITSGTALVQVHDWKAGRLTQELRGGKDMQYETLWYTPQGDGLLAVTGATQKAAVLAFFDLKQKRLLKEVAAGAPMFGLAVGEQQDAFYTVGRGGAVKWAFTA